MTKPVIWIGASLDDLKTFPGEVQHDLGFALWTVQQGDTPGNAKMLKGFGGGTTLELIEDHAGDAYRGVYTVRFAEAVYVLHCFQKKSKRGGELPRGDRQMIERRLKIAEETHRRQRRAD